MESTGCAMRHRRKIHSDPSFRRIIGSVEEMLDKPKSLKQRWLHRIRYARQAEACLG